MSYLTISTIHRRYPLRSNVALSITALDTRHKGIHPCGYHRKHSQFTRRSNDCLHSDPRPSARTDAQSRVRPGPPITQPGPLKLRRGPDMAIRHAHSSWGRGTTRCGADDRGAGERERDHDRGCRSLRYARRVHYVEGSSSKDLG